MNPKNLPIFLGIIALALGWMFWSGDGLNLLGVEGIKNRRQAVQEMQDSLGVLRAQTDSVKGLVASGRIEEVRARVASYQNSLDVLRRFVPEGSEVPDLMDAITTRAKIRGVQMAAFNPETVQPGPAPYDTHGYFVAVIGRYDQVGNFLSDIAGLRRIIVPQDLRLAAAPAASGVVLGDTSRALLEARFNIRTFVKASSAAGGANGN